jgi:hypothetical protein
MFVTCSRNIAFRASKRGFARTSYEGGKNKTSFLDCFEIWFKNYLQVVLRQKSPGTDLSSRKRHYSTTIISLVGMRAINGSTFKPAQLLNILLSGEINFRIQAYLQIVF